MIFELKIDDTYPFIVEDIGLDPFILSIDTEVGGKVEFGKIARNGTMNVTLNNKNGEFYPNNTGSIFYDKLLPNRVIKFYVDGVIKWVGYIESLEVPLSRQSPKAVLKCRQYLEDWDEVYMRNPMYVDQLHSSLAGQILDDNQLLSPYATNVFVIGASHYDTDPYTENPSTVLDNQFDNQLVIPYASIGWGKEVSVVDALRDLIDAVVGLGFVKSDGQLFLCPYYYYLITAADLTIDLDNDVESAEYTSKEAIKNVILTEWNELKTLSGAIDTFNVDVTAGTTITKTVKPTAKTNEEKKYILDSPTFSCADATVEFTLLDYSIDSVEVEIYSPHNTLDAEEITLSGNYIAEAIKEEYTAENLTSILKFRQRYRDSRENELLSNLAMVQSYASQWLAILADDFHYIETIKITNNDTITLGQIIQFTSADNFLPASTKHIVTGAKHRYETNYVSSTYTLYGGDAVNGFIIGVSEYDSGAYYL